MIEKQKPIFAAWNPIVWVVFNAAVFGAFCAVATAFSRVREDFDVGVPMALRMAPWEKLVLTPAFAALVGIVLVSLSVLSIWLARDRERAHWYCEKITMLGTGVFAFILMYASYMPVLAW